MRVLFCLNQHAQADIRAKISDKLYNGLIKPDEVFVSDGAKCDIARLQMMFGVGVTSAVQVKHALPVLLIP